jgi:peptidoglycan/LPS O-acetylase OafA/YrhL
MPISKSTSTYLDLVRWVAASAVVLFHFQDHHFGPAWLTRYFPSNGQGYVMVFFVISGFLISMAAEQKTALEFSIDRSIRIYIVAIPVLMITMALAMFFPHADLGYREAVGHPLLTFFLNASFLCQSWSLSSTPYLDAPYWSLAYEVMYYLIFGAFIYSGRVTRWVITTLLCIVAGPKILVLMPCWLAGVATYKFRCSFIHSKVLGWFAVIAGPAILIIMFPLGLKTWANEISMRFSYLNYTPSEGFVRNWFVAIAVAIHLWGICRISIKFPAIFERAARKLAGMSYSLYLLHLPVITMIAYWWGEKNSLGFILAAIPIVYIVCFLFSKVTEDRRHSFRAWLERKVDLGATQRTAARR